MVVVKLSSAHSAKKPRNHHFLIPVVLALVFLKYASDVFTKRRETLQRLVDDRDSDAYMPTDEAKRTVLEDRE
jgi:type I restriction-modification system DNA methylase subunit